jgi:hypothetical protein
MHHKTILGWHRCNGTIAGKQIMPMFGKVRNPPIPIALEIGSPPRNRSKEAPSIGHLPKSWGKDRLRDCLAEAALRYRAQTTGYWMP